MARTKTSVAHKTSVAQKQTGQPIAVDAEKSVSVRLPGKLLDAVDAWASTNETSRAEAIRRLIERGLAPQPPDPYAIFERAIARLKEAPARD
jgi:hypothetical protein